MFSRVVTFTDVKDPKGGAQYAKDKVVPLVREQKGYLSMGVSWSAVAKDLTVMTVWDTRENVQTSDPALAERRSDAVGVMGASGVSLRIYEVFEAQIVRAPTAGCYVRLVPTQGDPKTRESRVEYFRNEILPHLKSARGFCAVRILGDPTTGEGITSTVWLDREASYSLDKIFSERTQTIGMTFGESQAREILFID